jgi:hypothetical protein
MLGSNPSATAAIRHGGLFYRPALFFCVGGLKALNPAGHTAGIYS